MEVVVGGTLAAVEREDNEERRRRRRRRREDCIGLLGEWLLVVDVIFVEWKGFCGVASTLILQQYLACGSRFLLS